MQIPHMGYFYANRNTELGKITISLFLIYSIRNSNAVSIQEFLYQYD